MIKIMITDVDGVLTDGKIYLSMNGEEQKSICLKDLDAVSEIAKSGMDLAVITGENNAFSDYIIEKLHPQYSYCGCKNKVEAIKEIRKQTGYLREEICYIGDGKYDIEPIKYVGVSICPKDAIEEVRQEASHILSAEGGSGCLSEAISFVRKRNIWEEEGQSMGETKKEEQIKASFLEHYELVKRVMQEEELSQSIQQCVERIEDTFWKDGQVLLCGNGGSAADAQHIATEFVSRFYLERKALNAEALTVNTSALTAITNDYDYEKVFARQVEAKGKAGDVIIGITTSGCSKNIIAALIAAKKKGMTTVALIGENQEKMKKVADIIIAVPSTITPRIQEMHITIGHTICEIVEKDLFGK